MKRFFLIVVALIIVCTAYGSDADTLRSKKGAVILPMKGDFSFSIDAVPFLNMLNPKGESPGYYFPNYFPAIYFKYMVSDRSALMAAPIIKLNVAGRQPERGNLGESNVDDMEFGFRFGYERRSGKSRLQIPYGIEGGFSWFSSSSYNNTNGNIRIEGIKLFTSLFIGTDYFILPKISLGGRFAFGFMYSTTYEWLEDNSFNTYSYSLDYNDFGGALMLNFYF